VSDVDAVAADVSVAVDADVGSTVAVESVAVEVEAVSVAEPVVAAGSVVTASVVLVASVVVVVVVLGVPVLSLTSPPRKAFVHRRISTGRPRRTRETTWFVWGDFLREKTGGEKEDLRQGRSDDGGWGPPGPDR
jgi:hypothetical protein